ncbi:hypothetical protein BDV59DRAFT_183187 [Aspergillus ambiguus]|uniref:uncharacterized protein n=1 Tax=Aspergillus ambiguus TaxID=176160 RepID=UPI003CCE00C2
MHDVEEIIPLRKRNARQSRTSVSHRIPIGVGVAFPTSYQVLLADGRYLYPCVMTEFYVPT